MSATWDITLERRISREQFDRVCSEIGLLPNGDIYYDARVDGNELACVNLGGVEVYFHQGTQSDSLVSDSLVIRSCASEKRYEAMKRTASDLGQKIQFKSISGEWFDEVSVEPLPYSPDVYQRIEDQRGIQHEH